ncbi:hypothetical protein GQR58_026450 [Nymphon striatum]|nr:hypothetical protein GQR58_026450 [Nymphon striatum]
MFHAFLFRSEDQPLDCALNDGIKIYTVVTTKNNNERWWWIRLIFERRQQQGAYRNTVREMRSNDHEYYLNSISAGKRLSTTLRTNQRYCSRNDTDWVGYNAFVHSGLWRNETGGNGAIGETQRTGTNMYSQNAGHIRDNFTDYFVSDRGKEPCNILMIANLKEIIPVINDPPA